MDLGYTHIIVELFTKDTGRRICRMVKGYRSGQMEVNTKAIIKKE